jgi:hypothetical protein
MKKKRLVGYALQHLENAKLNLDFFENHLYKRIHHSVATEQYTKASMGQIA